jgi:hypothetical protein
MSSSLKTPHSIHLPLYTLASSHSVQRGEILMKKGINFTLKMRSWKKVRWNFPYLRQECARECFVCRSLEIIIIWSTTRCDFWALHEPTRGLVMAKVWQSEVQSTKDQNQITLEDGGCINYKKNHLLFCAGFKKAKRKYKDRGGKKLMRILLKFWWKSEILNTENRTALYTRKTACCFNKVGTTER